MKAMQPGLRDDLATKSDVADLRAEIADKLRDQTWKIVGAFGILGALTVTLSQLG